MSKETNDPWGASAATPDTTSPWGTSSKEANASSSWTNIKIQEDEVLEVRLFEESLIPLEGWVEDSLDWIVANFRDFFQAIRTPVDITLQAIEGGLQALHPMVIILFFTLFAWQVANRNLAIGTFFSFLAIGIIGIWSKAMVTLALVFTSVIFCILIGIPMGIWAAKSKRVSAILQPILDAMQTTPAFVYLIPIVMLFGIGNVPGVVVTIIFALPPLIRLTSLGICQVPKDLIEASHAFGASPAQMLFRVELPMAMPTIMAGINQTLMLSLSMVVIASMIAVGGLGQTVLRGIGRLDMGLAAVGGLGIVLLAIILDRLTQAMGKKETKVRRWYKKGPAGLIHKIIKKDKN